MDEKIKLFLEGVVKDPENIDISTLEDAVVFSIKYDKPMQISGNTIKIMDDYQRFICHIYSIAKRGEVKKLSDEEYKDLTINFNIKDGSIEKFVKLGIDLIKSLKGLSDMQTKVIALTVILIAGGHFAYVSFKEDNRHKEATQIEDNRQKREMKDKDIIQNAIDKLAKANSDNEILKLMMNCGHDFQKKCLTNTIKEGKPVVINGKEYTIDEIKQRQKEVKSDCEKTTEIKEGYFKFDELSKKKHTIKIYNDEKEFKNGVVINFENMCNKAEFIKNASKFYDGGEYYLEININRKTIDGVKEITSVYLMKIDFNRTK